MNLIRQYPEFYQPKSNLKRLSQTFASIIERSLDSFYTNEPNDPLAIKAHYIKTLFDQILEKSNDDDVDKTCQDLCKKYVEIHLILSRWLYLRFAYGKEHDGFKLFEEKFLRETIRNFPYKHCALLQQLVRLIAPVTLVR